MVYTLRNIKLASVDHAKIIISSVEKLFATLSKMSESVRPEDDKV